MSINDNSLKIKNIGFYLRQVISAKNDTLRGAAVKMNVSARYISLILKGERGVGPVIAERIANYVLNDCPSGFEHQSSSEWWVAMNAEFNAQSLKEKHLGLNEKEKG